MVDGPDPFEIDAFEAELPVRDLLVALNDPLARRAVYYLYEETDDTVDHLADVVTGWTNASTGTIATRTDRDRTRLLLYHVHLPMLDSVDVLQFHPVDRTVTMDGVSPAMESFLERIRGLDRTDGGGDRR